MGVERSFVIADLVGFTAAVDAHGDEVAVELAETLVRAADRALGPGDAVVKGMGDAVLVVSEGPRDAVGFVRRLFDEFADEADQLPVLRAGAHHGSAIARGGDYFGAGVNVAARVADLSAGCQVLATGAIAEAARGLGVGVVDLGWYDLRNVSDPVHLFEIDCGHDVRGHTIDPVCQMRVERSGAAGSLRHGGRQLWFCSLECVGRFAADPERYLDGNAR